MTEENIIQETLSLKVGLDRPAYDQGGTPKELDTITHVLSKFQTLSPDSIFIAYGRAHQLVLPHEASPESGTQWHPNPGGGGTLELVLARVDTPVQQVRIKFIAYPDNQSVGDDPAAYLVTQYNPTTILAGNNLLPATIADPVTGEIDELPSSAPKVLTKVFRMPFRLLSSFAQQASLTKQAVFGERTLQAIEAGDIEVIRTQNCCYFPTPDVFVFLQTFAILFDQTIDDGKGVRQLANHLGLKFSLFRHPTNNLLTGVMLQKTQGAKVLWSFVFYDKRARVAQMRQGKSLTAEETATVQQNVRFDITVHRLALVTAIINPARKVLPELIKINPRWFAKLETERFLTESPRPTVWWLERAIFILSLVQFAGQLRRESFGRWLIPMVIRRVLRLDCIAGFKSSDLDALVTSTDPIIVAWRDEKSADLDDWAGALATRANCAKSSVYAQRKKVLQAHKIDIALPFAFYRDLVFFGPNSVTKPQDRAALNAALAGDDAATNLRLRQKAAAEFDRRRIGVVGRAIAGPPLPLPVKVPVDRQAPEIDEATAAPAVLVKPQETGPSPTRPRPRRPRFH
jgi:hypothetical protein